MGTTGRIIQIGEVLEGRYRVLSEGTLQDLGIAYKAHDVQHDRLVTLLVLARRFGTGVEALNRIAQANQMAADLQLPALVPLEDGGLVDGQPYLVRGPVAGRSLAELLRQVGTLELDVALEIAVRLCDALTPLHLAGLVHGGLSPHSVLVKVEEGPSGEHLSLGSGRRLGPGIAVLDTGLIPALRPLSVAPGQPWGRSPYLSPEQAAGEDAHPSSDVYVIGSLLYEMVTGRPPFRASDEMVLVLQHLRQDPPSLQILVPQVPLTLVQIVQKALAKEPATRYRNAGQLAHILRAQLDQRTATPMPAPRPVPVKERLVVPPPAVPSAPPRIETHLLEKSGGVRMSAGGEGPRRPPNPQLLRRRIETYETDEEDEDWAPETGGMDWVLAGLVVVALIAVLGLIPLWRTVYHRYAVPAPYSTPVSYYWSESETASVSTRLNTREGGTKGGRGLDDFELVWYNRPVPGTPPAPLVLDPWMGAYLRANGVGDEEDSLLIGRVERRDFGV